MRLNPNNIGDPSGLGWFSKWDMGAIPEVIGNYIGKRVILEQFLIDHNHGGAGEFPMA